jgi:hypothetical protein
LHQIERLDREEESTGVPRDERTTFPVTQLVNSLLGLIVFPKEGFEGHIEDVSLDALVQRGWPSLRIDYPTPQCKQRPHRQCTDLRELVRVLRNGVSHFNVEFRVDQESREITEVRLANRCRTCKQETTLVTMSVPELKQVAMLYADSIIRRAVETDGYRSTRRATPP